jgi:DNA-binding PadR family transcriptional regulator
MRRKQGELIPLERKIIEHIARNNREFYGYEIASELRYKDSVNLLGNGTIYRALNRLEKFGILTSHIVVNDRPNTPNRKYYRLNEAKLKEYGV